jgi:hypothetical protein
MSFRMAMAIAVWLTLGSAAVSAQDRALRVSAADKAACMPDARRLCRDAMPNVRRVVMCFLGQRAKLSSGCRAVLASYGF